MKRYEVTLQLDVPDAKDVSFLGLDIVTVIEETWNNYKNIEVINSRQLTITKEEAISRIQELLDETGPITYIEPKQIQSILDLVGKTND
jgi:H2-forming N5,N10-methylenetetrahydromethanopterin dehydrogenase-like enzyme